MGIVSDLAIYSMGIVISDLILFSSSNKRALFVEVVSPTNINVEYGDYHHVHEQPLTNISGN